jgi:hypothetical protein
VKVSSYDVEAAKASGQRDKIKFVDDEGDDTN